MGKEQRNVENDVLSEKLGGSSLRRKDKRKTMKRDKSKMLLLILAFRLWSSLVQILL